jgi:hypothetical protein
MTTLRSDPFELESIIADNPRKDVQLSRRLNALTSCVGIVGRDPEPRRAVATANSPATRLPARA